MLKIVTHCYAALLPQFAQALKYHLASCVHYPPDTPTQFVIIHHPRDRTTTDVLDYYQMTTNAQIERIALSDQMLSRRAIGRNFATLSAKDDDVYWFADVDYFFGERCLDTTYTKVMERNTGHVLFYPRYIRRDRDYQFGTRIAPMGNDLPFVPDFPSKRDFERWKRSYAIGGTFIVRGSYVRRYGYVPDHKEHHTPDPEGIFGSVNREDVTFRQDCKERGGQTSLRIPNVYRIRFKLSAYSNMLLERYRERFGRYAIM